MLNRHQKEELVASLRNDFSNSQGSFLVGMQGLTVEQMQSLRRKIREKGGRLQVAKVKLVKRALEGLEEKGDIASFLKNQLAIVFFQEPVAVAKILCDFAGAHENLRLVVGSVESSVMGADEIKSLATLPAREVLLGQLIAAIQSPLTGMVFVLNHLIASPVALLEELEKKKVDVE